VTILRGGTDRYTKRYRHLAADSDEGGEGDADSLPPPKDEENAAKQEQ